MTRKPKRKKLTQDEKAIRAAEKTTATIVKRSTPKTADQHMLRHQGMIDYVTDPDCRPINWHWSRPDRQYEARISLARFRDWASADGWKDRREKFWEEISTKVMERQAEELFVQRSKETDELVKLRGHLLEHMMPVVDYKGKVKRYPQRGEDGKRHPLAGKPILPYKIESYDKGIKMFIELEKQLLLRRGEVTKRVEHAAVGAQPGTGVTALDPATRSVKFSKDEVRAMARKVLLMRQPELAEHDILGIDEGEGADHDGADESI